MVNRLRLATGLILFVFVSTHIATHGLGIVSVEAMTAGIEITLEPWYSAPGSLLLAASVLIHFGIGLRSFYQRRTLHMPPGEAAQLLSGLIIPLMLMTHITGTLVASNVIGIDPSYDLVLYYYWVLSPYEGVIQGVAVLLAWLHGCIGLYFYLRLKSWFRRWTQVALAAAIIVPTLALAGYVSAGLAVARAAQDPAWITEMLSRANVEPGMEDFVASKIPWIAGIYLGVVLSVVAARLIRDRLCRSHSRVQVTYSDRRRPLDVPEGWSVLEVVREVGIGHASVCGGRGRCSTCRVDVVHGLERQPEADEAEMKVLHRVKAGPTVRLACQLRPTSNISVIPLLPPTATARDALRVENADAGREAEIAILFADIRGFTSLSEGRLPYDVVFILNRYFAAMGRAITGEDGYLDKFIGDGVMALFGLGTDTRTACRQALAAAASMGRNLDRLNQGLGDSVSAPIRIGIGIHAGPAIVGKFGFGKATALTAVGDAVNTASRLEGMTKQFGVQLIVSDAVADFAGVDLGRFPADSVEARGRDERVAVRLIQVAEQVRVQENRAD